MTYKTLVTIDFHDPGGAPLHAKILLTDRTKGIVGSANLSWGGMIANYEIGLLIEGEGVWRLVQVFDVLRSSKSASRLRTSIKTGARTKQQLPRNRQNLRESGRDAHR